MIIRGRLSVLIFMEEHNNFNAVFTNKQISTNVTYTYVQNFKDTIGFRPLLEQHLQQYNRLKAQNSTYSIADAVNFMVDVVFQRRFSHMEELRKDQAYLSICGGGEILLVGINYDRENRNKPHSCVIERVEKADPHIRRNIKIN